MLFENQVTTIKIYLLISEKPCCIKLKMKILLSSKRERICWKTSRKSSFHLLQSFSKSQNGIHYWQQNFPQTLK